MDLRACGGRNILHLLGPNTMMYLTADPATSTVYLDAYTSGSTNQHWNMILQGGSNALGTASTDSRISGKKLYYNNGFQLSSTSFSVVGYFNIDWYIPCTAMNIETVILGVGDTVGLSSRIIYTPSNANVNGAWLDYTSLSPSICTVSSSGVVTGVSMGIAFVRVTHRVSRASTLCTVRVGYPTRFLIYYDEAFAYTCENSSTLLSSADAQLSVYFNAVKERYEEF